MSDGVLSNTQEINRAQQTWLARARLERVRQEANQSEQHSQDLKDQLRIAEYRSLNSRSSERVLMLEALLEKGDGQLPVPQDPVEQAYSSTTPEYPRYQPGELYHRTA